MYRGFGSYLKGKWIYLIVMIVVMIVSYHYGTYLVASRNNNVAIGSMEIWKSHESADFSQSKIDLIKEEYGSENVTLSNSWMNSEDFDIHSVENTFINNGVTVNNPDYFIIIEEVVLIKGSLWQAGTTEKVVVIDEATASKYFNGYDVINKSLTIEGESWKVIGVVSDTSSRLSNYEHDLKAGYEVYLDDFETNLYIPLYFNNYTNQSSENVEPASIIINTGKWLSGFKEQNEVLDLIVDGDNFILMSDNTKYSIVGVATGSYFGLHSFKGYYISLLLPFIALYGVYSYKKFQARDRIFVRNYISDDNLLLQSLSINKEQMVYLRPVDEIINVYCNNKDTKNLYIIESNQTVVGMSLIDIDEEHQNVLVSQFLIDKDYQNLKIGRKALRKIIGYIEERSYTITAKTTLANKNGQEFLEKSGFTVFSENEGNLNYRYKLR